MQKKHIITVVIALLLVGFFSYRTGREDGNDARDAYHLKNDLRGSVSLACTSNIADNPRYRNIFVNYDEQVVMYSPELHINYDHQSVFFDKGNNIVTLMDGHYFVEVNQVSNFVRFSIQKNGNFVDSLDCQVQQQ